MNPIPPTKNVANFGVFALLLAGSSAVAADVPSPATATVPLSASSAIRFADVAAAREILTANDAFFKALSPFDRQVRLKTDRPVTADEFLKAAVAAAEAAAWEKDEIERITHILRAIRPKLEPFKLPLPKTVLLVKTSGREEGNAAYTRGAAIVLPRRMAARPAEALLLHELFHVLSRHDQELRDRLYAILGFTRCGPVAMPPDLEARRITNPDAPVIEHRIRLNLPDDASNRRDKPGGSQKEIDAVPILLSSTPRYDAKRGGSLFDYMKFHLLAVERDGDRWRAKLKDGQPMLLDPNRTESYHQQIGRNTKYIIHPEEILADNFVLLVTGKRNVPTPRILDEMQKALTNQ
jgi:hypothetical protein